jgi:L-threonylcarbamoyladenylate synthase
MKYKHYAPKTQLFLLEGSAESAIQIALSEPAMVVLCPREERSLWPGNMQIFEYTSSTLFAVLRELDTQDHPGAFVRLPSQEGLGLAMRNRLMRASGFRIWK